MDKKFFFQKTNISNPSTKKKLHRNFLLDKNSSCGREFEQLNKIIAIHSTLFEEFQKKFLDIDAYLRENYYYLEKLSKIMNKSLSGSREKKEIVQKEKTNQKNTKKKNEKQKNITKYKKTKPSKTSRDLKKLKSNKSDFYVKKSNIKKRSNPKKDKNTSINKSVKVSRVRFSKGKSSNKNSSKENSPLSFSRDDSNGNSFCSHCTRFGTFGKKPRKNNHN